MIYDDCLAVISVGFSGVSYALHGAKNSGLCKCRCSWLPESEINSYIEEKNSGNRCLILAPAAMSLTDYKCFYGALTKIKRERVDAETDPGSKSIRGGKIFTLDGLFDEI